MKMHREKKLEQDENIRKGPWKSEEDEVLIQHVKKYGPRDWSSIRSKGFLQRTGKSCRLRWVNKLRPNLKNGCKFSVEEERIVIDLQREFGNRWAKIASSLPGRTDNDVKNFWSSRQKRLARLLKTSSSTTTLKSHKNKTKDSASVPTSKAPKFTSSSEGESSTRPQSCSLPCIENSEQVIKMVPLADLIKTEQPSFDTSYVEQEFNPFASNEHIAFPQISELQTDLTFPMESQQDLFGRVDDQNLFDVFGPLDSSEFGMVPQHPLKFPFFDPSESCRIDSNRNIDNFFDDFPQYMFDDINQPPSSPSKL